jgi:beta-lactamase superfamily II metal-dependent hydrolase
MVWKGRLFSGYLLRLVKFKSDVRENVGLTYVLISKEMYDDNNIEVGRTYRITREMTERGLATFADIEFRVARLTNIGVSQTAVEEHLTSTIKRLVAAAKANTMREYTNGEARPLKALKRKKRWARVHIHNVGQGDTIVLELPGDQIWMVDARFWRRDRRNDFDEWMRSFGQKINRVIISHLHYDHIHSIPYVVQKYDPEEVVTDGFVHPTSATLRALAFAGHRLRILPGEELTTMGGLDIQLHRTDLFSQIQQNKDPNEHEVSVVLKSKNGFAFLPGDLPAGMCEALLENAFCAEHGTNVIYKVSHHGSRSGFSQSLFEALSPEVSVISCSRNNRYGHPDSGVKAQLPNCTCTYEWSESSRPYELLE